ncbi:MAG: Dabb family protein [Oscillospiraceae bacterium]|jgi:hypothetical protein|nr:Dabb family protein [Oscillospiraceae bacterium]
MVTHIVFWKLQDENKAENAAKIKVGLEALVGVVPGLLDLTVGLNQNGGEYDLCLLSHFSTGNALKAYDEHPEHQRMRAFIRGIIVVRAAVDY